MLQNESTRGPALDAKLTAESTAWQELLSVLEQEEQALIVGEADLLPKLNALKMAHLHSLSTMVRTRHEGLVSAGLTPDHAGMNAWLEQQGKPKNSDQWEKLQTMEQQSQEINLRIGTLIELRLNSTRQALNVLVQAATSQGGLYDQAGCSVATRNGKPLTAA
ncbi:MAG: flagellar protein FlgN [Sulfuriferula multivorans]|uniref:Flagellar protein FlgN n=1 Tax=Sulfuriferula multivorans TaxID=1559896 RepID=A0A7C9JV86_9PROT|nr:flagellar protein FlgN [Sulfuriferula multivorans]